MLNFLMALTEYEFPFEAELTASVPKSTFIELVELNSVDDQ